MGSTPKVLQTAFTGGVLHFGTFTTNVLNFVEWVGTIAGCLFCLFWCKVLHQKYTRLLTIGVATMVCYPVMMYFLIGIGGLIIFLLWDIQPIRSTLKKMPAWNFVGRKMKKNLA